MQVRRVYLVDNSATSLLRKRFVKVKLVGFKSKFLRLLVAWMAHNHIEQYPTG